MVKKDIPIIEEDPSGQGYYEIFPDRTIYHKNKNFMKFPSKKQLDDEKPTFALLTPEDYHLVITKVELATQNKYKAKAKEDGSMPQEEVVKIQFQVLSYKDGATAYDENGDDATDRIVFFTGRPDSMGYMTDGTPSKTRCLIAYATDQDIDEELEIPSWDSLLGKKIFAQIIQKPNQAGENKNRIVRLLPLHQKRPKPKIEVKAEPKVESKKKLKNTKTKMK